MLILIYSEIYFTHTHTDRYIYIHTHAHSSFLGHDDDEDDLFEILSGNFDLALDPPPLSFLSLTYNSKHTKSAAPKQFNMRSSLVCPKGFIFASFTLDMYLLPVVRFPLQNPLAPSSLVSDGLPKQTHCAMVSDRKMLINCLDF